MSGAILAQVQRDSLAILANGGFENDVVITKDDITITCKGLAPAHHLRINPEGQPVNSKTAHVTVHEDSLQGLIVRNSNNEVYLRNAIVSFSDSSGISKNYIVKENFSDDTIGVIVLMLGLYDK